MASAVAALAGMALPPAHPPPGRDCASASPAPGPAARGREPAPGTFDSCAARPDPHAGPAPGTGAGADTGAGAGMAMGMGGIMDSFLANASYSSPLLQLFLFLYHQLGAQLGLDPSLLLTLLAFLWGLSKLGSQVWACVWDLLDRHFMCAMYVSEFDHIYFHLMKWLSLQKSISESRFLMAQTVWKSAWEDEEELDGAIRWSDPDAADPDDSDPDSDPNLDPDLDPDGEATYLNFSSQAARSCPRYVPAMGVTGFWHKGTYFRVHRRKESFMSVGGWGGMKDLEEVRVSCFGRSIEPIKQLLADAKLAYYHDSHRKTTIFRPRPKEMRRDHDGMWNQVARRPIRPMRTVVVDAREKDSVLADINEYLHPATPRWYASRGIPLRRGYLFHGPPGTGKTSFSFALAGVFGIDIYVISLQDATITEEDLAMLFARLPRRCIVLLEDIDTAGLIREDEHHGKSEAKEAKQAAKDGQQGEEVKDVEGNPSKGPNGNHKARGKKKGAVAKAKESDSDGGGGGGGGQGLTDGEQDSTDGEQDSTDGEQDSTDGEQDSDSSDDQGQGESSKRRLTRVRGRRKAKSPRGISLSGLLNAIDGVASHEGRVLIMTTNKPESLDEALIRPGRVDVQVAFANASSEQAAELFCRMYEEERPRQHMDMAQPQPSKPGGKAAPAGCDKASLSMTSPPPLPSTDEPRVSEAELKTIAGEFGRRIPRGTFSPAEIQGFLLKRKKNPHKALADVEGWVEAAMRQKEANSKVLTVQ